MHRSTIEALYRRSFRSLVTAATAVLHNRADAEDIVQNVFVALLEGRADHLPPGPALDAFVANAVIELANGGRAGSPTTEVIFSVPVPRERAA